MKMHMYLLAATQHAATVAMWLYRGRPDSSKQPYLQLEESIIITIVTVYQIVTIVTCTIVTIVTCTIVTIVTCTQIYFNEQIDEHITYLEHFWFHFSLYNNYYSVKVNNTIVNNTMVFKILCCDIILTSIAKTYLWWASKSTVVHFGQQDVKSTCSLPHQANPHTLPNHPCIK